MCLGRRCEVTKIGHQFPDLRGGYDVCGDSIHLQRRGGHLS